MKLSTRVPLVLAALIALVAVSCSCNGGNGTPTPTPAGNATATPAGNATASPTATATPVEYLEHVDEESGFAILYPQDWEDYTSEGVLVAFGAGEADVECAPQFNVVAEELSAPTTVDAWFEEMKGNFTAVAGYTAISEEQVTVDGVAAIKHVCSFDVYEVSFTAMLLYAVEDTVGWTVFSTCRSDGWVRYEPVFDTVLGGFRLLD